MEEICKASWNCCSKVTPVSLFLCQKFNIFCNQQLCVDLDPLNAV